jgi:hypothetical protein
MPSDLAANSFDRTTNSNQNAIDVPSDLDANSVDGLQIRLKAQ